MLDRSFSIPKNDIFTVIITADPVLEEDFTIMILISKGNRSDHKTDSVVETLDRVSVV
jgi:hypothetical protein